MKSIQTLPGILLYSIVISTSSFAIADTTQAIETSKWKCQYCVIHEGWSSDIEIGLGYLSDDSYKFGQYNADDEKGVSLLLNGKVTYRDADASYIDIDIDDIARETGSLDVEAGFKGDLTVFFNVDQLQHIIDGSAKTPYLGSGTNNLTLPGSWVQSGTTAGMTNLISSLNSVDLSTKRKRLGTGLSYRPDSNWKYAFSYNQDIKEGTQRIAGSFFFNTAQIVQPIDYKTEQIDVSVAYNAADWQARLAYYGSTFSNSNSLLGWQNAYTPFVAGADSGQLALPPDNQFQQFIVSAGYDLNEFSRLDADIAIGNMEQNDPFLAATQNASLTVSAQPAASPNAKVDTINAKLKITSSPSDDLTLSAKYTLDDRDNKTAMRTYNGVTTDLFVSTPRQNLPYSIKKNKINLKADYLADKGINLGVGYDLVDTQRTYQDMEKTKEDTLWGQLRIRNIKGADFSFKLLNASRKTEDYLFIATIFPPQNTLLKKFYLADRDRTAAQMHSSIEVTDSMTAGFYVEFAKDDYDGSNLGLTNSDTLALNADLVVMLSESANFSIYLGRENIKSTQTGSHSYSTADWNARNDDTFDTYGINYRQIIIEDTLDIGVDVTVSNSSGKVSYNNGATTPAYPDLLTNLDQISVFMNYKLEKDMDLRLDLMNEHYTSRNWAFDGVLPNTISNAIVFGEISPAYNVNVIIASIRYKF